MIAVFISLLMLVYRPPTGTRKQCAIEIHVGLISSEKHLNTGYGICENVEFSVSDYRQLALFMVRGKGRGRNLANMYMQIVCPNPTTFHITTHTLFCLSYNIDEQ